MQQILLSRGYCAWVDDEDFDLCSMYGWYYSTSGYAVAHAKGTNGTKTHVFLHVLIALRMGLVGEMFDHEDRDKLNCQRYNIRPSNKSLNMANSFLRPTNKLGAKGITFHQGKYRATIKFQGKPYHIGSYWTLEEAKAAYKAKGIQFFGEHFYDGD